MTKKALKTITENIQIYARIKEQIVKNIYINSVSHILSTKYKFTAFGQFY